MPVTFGIMGRILGEYRMTIGGCYNATDRNAQDDLLKQLSLPRSFGSIKGVDSFMDSFRYLPTDIKPGNLQNLWEPLGNRGRGRRHSRPPSSRAPALQARRTRCEASNHFRRLLFARPVI